MEVKITDNSKLFINAKNEAVTRALQAVGMTAERHAKERCPVDTGLLRNSITYAVSGEAPAISEYKASYGSNTHMVRNKETGQMEKKRYSARSKNAGTVKSGSYSGKAPNDPPSQKGVYIGTNVEYAKKQETGDYKHTTGASHFLRDAASTHGDEYKRIIEAQLRKG